MSEIIPRKKAIPVQARRAEPEVIQIPGAVPIETPPPAAGVTQNIIYVTVPAGQAPPPIQPPPQNAPTEVHIHTTNVYEARPRGRRRGVSFLGCLGIVIAGVAVGAEYVPQFAAYARTVIEVGAGVSVLGLLGAMLFGNVGSGVPFLGLIANALVFGLILKNAGQLPASLKVPALDLGSTAAPAVVSPPAAPVNPPVSAVKPISPKPPVVNPNPDHSIFGDGTGNWQKPADTAVPQPAVPVVPAQAIPTPPQAPMLDKLTAAANLERARIAAAARLGVDYNAAKTAAAEAQSEYQDARIANAPGSPELIAASQKHLNADAALNEIVQKLRADPAVSAAEKALRISSR